LFHIFRQRNILFWFLKGLGNVTLSNTIIAQLKNIKAKCYKIGREVCKRLIKYLLPRTLHLHLLMYILEHSLPICWPPNTIFLFRQKTFKITLILTHFKENKHTIFWDLQCKLVLKFGPWAKKCGHPFFKTS